MNTGSGAPNEMLIAAVGAYAVDAETALLERMAVSGHPEIRRLYLEWVSAHVSTIAVHRLAASGADAAVDAPWCPPPAI